MTGVWFQKAKFVRFVLLGALTAPLFVGCKEDPKARDWTYLFTTWEREGHGLGGLWTNDYLRQQAVAHAKNMCSQGKIFHSNLTDTYGGQAWAKLGENVGVSAQQDSQAAATDVWNAWMNSPDHRANILANWHDHGVGAVRCDKDDRLYFAHAFRR